MIGGIGYTNFDLWAAGRRPQNFYMLGSMGLAVPIALGVALAQPRRKVIALEGDGSILMQVGSLATVAARRQKNLAIVIMDNGTYQITGGQLTSTELGADIVAMARGAGIAQSAWAADEGAFEELIELSLHEDGPWLIGCRIDREKPAGYHGTRSAAHPRSVHARAGGEEVISVAEKICVLMPRSDAERLPRASAPDPCDRNPRRQCALPAAEVLPAGRSSHA